ncbi:hypothetical protein FVF58_16320 [Paraburkholderia panacisoli]|uniref:Uncharacterized protein n=1 Tax=Paraburkholderia panacisoli TaxID=2603818 RepID=A0A5B0H8D9_9BURK|nr:hypothetical protein FVF58_16320 [Paraburkholderia panacisoli]
MESFGDAAIMRVSRRRFPRTVKCRFRGESTNGQTELRSHADVVFTVFEMLRKELAVEFDDSVVLGRLHEIASLPAADFFAALGDLAAGLPTQVEPSVVLSRCAPLPCAFAKPLTIPRDAR